MIEWHDRLPSTQDRAHERAAAGAPHGTAVAARVQTGGRGTRGRVWASPEGGLWISVVARPARPASVECASLRIGLALAPALESIAGLDPGVVQLKWPNDLFVADRKLGGVLTEARWQGETPAWLVAGIGLNVRNPLPPDLPATRLADHAPDLAPEALAQPVVEAVLGALARGGPLDPAELQSFAERDWLCGRELSAPVAGRAAGVAPSGHLLVAAADGRLAPVSETVTLAGLAPGGGSR